MTGPGLSRVTSPRAWGTSHGLAFPESWSLCGLAEGSRAIKTYGLGGSRDGMRAALPPQPPTGGLCLGEAPRNEDTHTHTLSSL